MELIGVYVEVWYRGIVERQAVHLIQHGGKRFIVVARELGQRRQKLRCKRDCWIAWSELTGMSRWSGSVGWDCASLRGGGCLSKYEEIVWQRSICLSARH